MLNAIRKYADDICTFLKCFFYFYFVVAGKSERVDLLDCVVLSNTAKMMNTLSFILEQKRK